MSNFKQCLMATHHHSQASKMKWSKPQYENKRFGFEVTMYIAIAPTVIQQEVSKPKRLALRRCVGMALCALSLTSSIAVANISLLDLLAPSDNSDSFDNSPINASNVNQLQVAFQYLTVPDSGTKTINRGAVMTPAVKDGYLYFNDDSGNITKLNRISSAVVWKKNYATDLSVPGYQLIGSRSIPYLKDNMLIVGSNYRSYSAPCNYLPTFAGNPCQPANGAIVLALDQRDGHVIWRQKIETNPLAKVQTSISGVGPLIFAATSSWEEEAVAFFPNIYTNPIDPSSAYPCCQMRPSVVAMNVYTGTILWKTYIVPGHDEDNKLPPALHNLLTAKGFNGASIYGAQGPTIDLKRFQLYVTTAENNSAPQVADQCAQAFLATGNPNANIPGLPAGVTCANLNDKLHNYAHSVIALNMLTGKVNWVVRDRQFDQWNNSCSVPSFAVGLVPPVNYPLVQANLTQCSSFLPGPDGGWGNNPLLLDGSQCGGKDLLIVANKSGTVYAIHPDDGTVVYTKGIDPGGLLGGAQWARATDGKTVYIATSNSRNSNRDKTLPFVTAQQFLDFNGFGSGGLGLTHNFYSYDDTHAPVPNPAPSSNGVITIGPNLLFGTTFYPNAFPNPLGFPLPPFFITGPASGPDLSALWTLVKPPSDVVIDGNTVFYDQGVLKTTTGMITAMDASSGKILWQRPINDGSPLGGESRGSLTVGNGIVLAGYEDGQGTFVALNAKNGKKLFQYNSQVPITASNSNINWGGIESKPVVVGCRVYLGVGSQTSSGASLFDLSTFTLVNPNAGNRLISFVLPGCSY